MAGVYWIGQDGNYYVKAAGVGDPNVNNGVQNMGSSLAPLSIETINGLTQIQDPVGGGGSSAPSDGGTDKVFNQAGAANTQRTIDQIPGLLQAALAAEATSHGNVVGGYDASEKQQQGAYDTGTVTNQQNYDSNFMDSIRAGIKGLGGLMALLRGTGAGGGTAEDLARDTVGGVTAGDIRGGKETRDENQGQLDSGLAGFLTDLKQKRLAAEDTFANNNRAIQRDSNTQLQDLFGKMAGFYGDAGNAGAANEWMNRAGGLTPDIAANSKTQVSPYDTSPVVVHAPNLTAFASPTQPSVTTAPGGQVGSGIFTISDSRRRKDNVATPVPIGA